MTDRRAFLRSLGLGALAIAVPQFGRWHRQGSGLLVPRAPTLWAHLDMIGAVPGVVLGHPVDWETILLEKGSDERYVWAVVADANGSRIWGHPVSEEAA